MDAWPLLRAHQVALAFPFHFIPFLPSKLFVSIACGQLCDLCYVKLLMLQAKHMIWSVALLKSQRQQFSYPLLQKLKLVIPSFFFIFIPRIFTFGGFAWSLELLLCPFTSSQFNCFLFFEELISLIFWHIYTSYRNLWQNFCL